MCDYCGAPLAAADEAPAVALPLSAPVSGQMSGIVCPVCRRTNRAGSIFCAFCGQRLAPQTGAPSGQNGHQPGQPVPQAMPYAGAAVSAPSIPFGGNPVSPAGNLAVNTLLKRRYRVIRKIAQGGMGAVYEANDLTVPGGRHWAIKEMSPAALAPSERAQAITDFRREAQILATLHHPNLPEVVETFEEAGKYFLVMEFIPGRTLLNIVDTASGFIPEDRIMVWMRQLLNVLHYLHSQDPPIIYRDLKPSNVMLVEGTERIKLIDFGIARFHKAGKSRDTEAFGTAGYAPPEQYGKGQTDQRSDIYALGATLHHLVTRHDPSTNPFNWLPPRRYNPRISVQLDSALQRAVSLDPSRRFQSIEEFAQALGVRLEPVQKAQPAPAPVVQPQYPVAAPAPTPTPATVAPVTPAAQPAAAQPGTNGNGTGQAATAQPKSTSRRKKTQTDKTAEAPAASKTPTSRPAAPAAAPLPVSMPVASISPAVAASPAVMPVAPALPIPAVAPAPSRPAATEQPRVAASEAPTLSVPVQREIHEPTHTAVTLDSISSAPPPARKRETRSNEFAPALVVSDKLVDLGDVRWNNRPASKVKVVSTTGDVRGTVIASQPWIAFNPQHFQGNGVTLEVKVKKNQLPFGRVELQVPNLFAIIWSRMGWAILTLVFWFWLLLLVAGSIGKILLWSAGGLLAALLVSEVFIWLWAKQVRFLVPKERLNTGRLVVRSSGGEQQIEVRARARPSWGRKAIGWTLAVVLMAAEVAAVAWVVLTMLGVEIPLPLPGM